MSYTSLTTLCFCARALLVCVPHSLLFWDFFEPPATLRKSAGDVPAKRDTLFRNRGLMTIVILPDILALLWWSTVHGPNGPPGWARDINSVTKWEVVGCLVAVAGMQFRFWSQRQLAQLFTFAIGIRTNHTLVTTGPYRLLRHPGYTGLLLAKLGLAIMINNVWSWVGCGFMLVMLAVRVTQEEDMLRSHFGTQWDDYARTRKRLIPYVF